MWILDIKDFSSLTSTLFAIFLFYMKNMLSRVSLHLVAHLLYSPSKINSQNHFDNHAIRILKYEWINLYNIWQHYSL